MIKAIDAPSDRSVVDNGYSDPGTKQGALKSRAEVQGPDSQTDTEFIKSIMSQYEAYGEDAAYDPFARKGYNSNNFVSSLLVNSGVKKLPWGGNAKGIDPGYGQVIPSNFIKANGQMAPSGLGTVSSYAGRQGSNASWGAVQDTLRAIQNTLAQISRILSSFKK